MVYDCFTFYNELDLLEIRLNVLEGVVDRFVLVESPGRIRISKSICFFRKTRVGSLRSCHE